MAAMATQLGVPTGTMGVPASAIVGGAIGGLGQQFNERWQQTLLALHDWANVLCVASANPELTAAAAKQSGGVINGWLVGWQLCGLSTEFAHHSSVLA